MATPSSDDRVSLGRNDATGSRSAMFWCPGCAEVHGVTVDRGNAAGPQWGWNGSLSSPTFTPSIQIKTGHYTGGGCWCEYDKAHPDDKSGFTCGICHSFVRDGRIEFLSDCTHALAGTTVDIPLVTTWRGDEQAD